MAATKMAKNLHIDEGRSHVGGGVVRRVRIRLVVAGGAAGVVAIAHTTHVADGSAEREGEAIETEQRSGGQHGLVHALVAEVGDVGAKGYLCPDGGMSRVGEGQEGEEETVTPAQSRQLLVPAHTPHMSSTVPE